MCGIAGVIYKDRKTHQVGEALTSMLESLQHRGPD
jgi:glutamate synthase domain-containing protein 1